MGQVRVVIQGAAGRMGRRLVALAVEDPQLEVVAALDASTHPELGQDAGTLAGVAALHVPLSSTLEVPGDCLIDFSVPEALPGVVQLCAQRQLPLVLATTGLSDAQRAMVDQLAQSVAVVWSPSMSLAVNLTMKLAALAAESLRHCPHGADVEIIERHHRFKRDAPSGTALRFGELIAQAMGQTSARHGREGLVGERPHGEIGYHAVRIGDNPGEHSIVFGMLGESIELTVRASNRDCYALGALAAAKFVVQQSPGVYSMAQVLGL
jgi:4-hydroxy-tetrahydrodipicolinate reductase